MDITTALDEPLQPPMANGEVLFDEPWQGRVFGMAVTLHEAGMFAWSEFQASLIEVIAQWDRGASDTDVYQYYTQFQMALDRLLVAKGLVSATDLDVRSREFAARPHGHDHHHGDHHHGAHESSAEPSSRH